MKNKAVCSLFTIMLFLSCTHKRSQTKNYSFYHWKETAEFTPTYEKALQSVGVKKVYLHYFDIEVLKKRGIKKNGIYPTYILKSVAEEYHSFNIVPVVYITNNVLKSADFKAVRLADKIKKLIDRISEANFSKRFKDIQIDCDWTVGTKLNYFQLLRCLKPHFDVDVTIRLHQIKFQKLTGIPPVAKGTLMLYNVGDMKDDSQNSILQNSIVGQYITSNSSYPMVLNVALPIFSQTILTNNSNKVKILNNTDETVYENDKYFERLNETNYRVVKDTLYKGFYLTKGYNIKIERVAESEIISSYSTVINSNLDINEVIFYHLDDYSIRNYNLKNIIDKL